ncbi:PAS domain-containing protein (plasmid) [Aureimonas ureilytica]|uniref:PAS domain-containing protein n=1 Tax=Aureimonas ureilytica TaxID=401562 RepID=UPI003CF32D5A
MSDPLAFLAGGGEASRMIAERDWSGHVLGAPEGWPDDLRAALSLVLNSPESMILAWGPELSFFFNETYFPLLGPRLPWAMGERFDKVWADGWEQAKPIIDAAFAGERQRFVDLPWRLDTDRGARDTWWTFSYSRVLDARGEIAGLFIFTNETTDRVLSDAALTESEAQFRTFAEVVPNHVWAAGPDGEIYWFNQRVSAYTGLTIEGFGGPSGWGRAVHPADLPAAAATWAASLESGSAYETEFRIRRADGAYRWFLARAEPVRGEDGAILRWVGTNTDIDDRRRQAAELARFAARLEEQVRERTADRNALWQLTPDLMLRCAFDGTITAANPAWAEILGWQEHELLGTSLFDFVHPEDEARTMEGARELSNGQGHARFDNRYRRKDGTYRWISWSTRPSEGVINAIGRDITLDKERAEALAKTEEALRHAQKMEAVGQLTGGLAHDFNNLLAGISGSLELMARRLARGETGEMERYLTGAQGAARRAAALTHRLLAFSRRQTLAPKATDVVALVAEMEDLVRRTVGPGIALRIHSADDLWPVLVDPNQLENALLNLCINARDAMPDGGTLTIELFNQHLDAASAGERDLPPGDYVSLCVADTGTGMTADVLSRAMEPFFTTKPIGVGTGLGLSMIYGFVRQSGGQVRMDSTPGEGTRVCLHLPRHRGEAEGTESGDASAELPQAEAGQTVLVVDDEALVRMLIVEVLENLGYAALEAEDGPSALAELRRGGRIDLLVTDVGLPNGMNGRQVAEAARELRPDLKVLFVTGYAEGTVLNPEHLGPDTQVVTKPFALDDLARRIAALVSGN